MPALGYNNHESLALGAEVRRLGAGLTESDVRRFLTILREQFGVELALPEAWSRAVELMSLVEILSQSQGVVESGASSTGFALPRS